LSFEKKHKVLIVDDTPENLGVLFNLLNEKYEVLAAECGAVALEIIHEDKPDLILLDIMMPDISGFEVCKILKDDEKTSEIPIIFISALTDTNNKVEGFNLGGVDYITKPFQQEEVLIRVKTHLQIKNLSEDLKNANSLLEEKVVARTKDLEDELQENSRINLALVESENRFRMLFDSAPEVMLLIDISSGEVIDINKTGCELIGINYEDIIGTNHEDYFRVNDNKDDLEVQIEQLSKNKKRVFANNLIKVDGSIIPIETSVKTVLIEGNLCLLADIRDISERLMFQKELIDSKEEAEEMNRIKSIFLANMSHELRTPLISILGFSEILQEEITEDELSGMIKNIRSSGKRLLNSFNLLLRLTELESKDVRVEKENCELLNLVMDILTNYQGQLNEKRLELKIDIDPHFSVLADKNMLKEILNNIISNTFKFTNQGEIEISSSTTESEDKIISKIVISDSGIGIAEENLKSIFEPFRQSSEGYNRNYEGTGLGLTISKKLAELNNGEITVESEVGVGSTFTVAIFEDITRKEIIEEVEENKSL
jgi:PAS domain S-box-containing protein